MHSARSFMSSVLSELSEGWAAIESKKRGVLQESLCSPCDCLAVCNRAFRGAGLQGA